MSDIDGFVPLTDADYRDQADALDALDSIYGDPPEDENEWLSRVERDEEAESEGDE